MNPSVVIRKLVSSIQTSRSHEEVPLMAVSKKEPTDEKQETLVNPLVISKREPTDEKQETVVKPLVIKLEPRGLAENGTSPSENCNSSLQPLLRFHIKEENEEETKMMIKDLVAILPGNSVLEDCKPFQDTPSESIEKQQLSPFASNSADLNKPITIIPSRSPINQSNKSTMNGSKELEPDSSGIKVKSVSVQLEDLFPKSTRKHGLIHTGNKSCLCKYCSGFSCITDLPEHHVKRFLEDPTRQIEKNHQNGGEFVNKRDPSLKVEFRGFLTSLRAAMQYKCAHCLAEFKKKGLLIVHLKSHENESFPRVQSGADRRSSSNKQNIEERKYKCDVCCKVFYKKATLRNHIHAHLDERPFKCGICSKAFKRKGTLDDHQKVHNKEKTFKCKNCPAKFRRLYNLTVHSRVHTNQKPLKCDHCSATFNFPSNLKEHMRIHTGETPFACDKCPSKFRSSTCLKAHLKTHSGKRPFKCRKCSKGFRTISALNVHKAVHSAVKPFQCPDCKARFSQKSHLVQHGRAHEGDKSFQCSECPAAFIAKGSLRQHIESIHCVVKPFACKFCSGTFLSEGSMKRHLSIHNVVKPFPCKVCSETFSSERSMKKHEKIHAEKTHLHIIL